MVQPHRMCVSNPVKNQRHIEPPQKPTWGNKIKKYKPKQCTFLGEQIPHNYHTIFNVWCPQLDCFIIPYLTSPTRSACYSDKYAPAHNSTYRGEIANTDPPIKHQKHEERKKDAGWLNLFYNCVSWTLVHIVFWGWFSGNSLKPHNIRRGLKISLEKQLACQDGENVRTFKALHAHMSLHADSSVCNKE